ncbi:MmcQ/YjbR family DNA-binding protein [Kineococcus radiotolerans]|uniref:MmcQ/YjbR family DNA-binding protein n=1 Tax=Kineococcus radiotolerans TaxID=131568 RepID=UPI00003A3F09|nr:MmcQ/YjbR family DNA-binding protein [Kineococcus radiotolerans]
MVTGDTLRAWALELPEAHEEETWGAATFRVRAKIFAILRAEDGVVSVKASPVDQAELIAGDPRTYRVASHVGRFGWVEVSLAGADPTELRSVLLEAWRRTAPRRVQSALPDHLRALLPAPPG